MGGSWSNLSRRGFLGGVAAGVAVSALPGEVAGAEGAAGVSRLDDRMRSDRAWERFLAEQDLIWRRLPRAWYERPFLGNGFLGSMVYQEPGASALRFTINHCDFTFMINLNHATP